MPRTVLMIGFSIDLLETVDRRMQGGYIILIDPLKHDPQYMRDTYNGLQNQFTYIEMDPFSDRTVKSVDSLINGYITQKGAHVAGSGAKISRVELTDTYKNLRGDILRKYEKLIA